MSNQGQQTLIGETHQHEFQQRGLLYCPAAFSESDIGSARELVFDTLEKAKLWQDGEWTGGVMSFEAANSIRKRVTERCKKSTPYRELINQNILAAVQQLSAGAPTSQLLPYAQLLFTAPNASDWRMPTTMWHLDAPRLESGQSPGVQMFVLLHDVVPSGGGTLVVAGSHQLLNDRGHLRSKVVKQKLQQRPWFQRLLKGSDTDAPVVGVSSEVDGVTCEVVELTGQAGDVYFTDLRLLHTLAPNAIDQPRIMATQRFVATDAMIETYGPGAASRI